MRIDRVEYYLKMALLASERATCSRAKVGCVLTDTISNRVRSVGYNGSPKGVNHCIDSSCLLYDGHCILSVHAEINALSQLRGHWDNLTAYVTHAPCFSCYQALASFKVTRIFYLRVYKDEKRDLLINRYKIPIIKVDLSNE